MKKRIISFITAICLTVAVLPFKNYIDLFKNSMTAEAYVHINEYPDFSLDMYVADLMTNTSKEDYSYKMLSYFINEYVSPNSIFFENLRDDKTFRNSVTAWETSNAIFDPGAEETKTLDEVGYYEAIILNALNASFQSDEFYSGYMKKAYNAVDNIYSYFEDNSELSYFISNYKKLTDSELKDFGNAFEKAYEQSFSGLSLFSNSMDIIKSFFKVCDTLYELVDKIVAYYICNQMTDEMKLFVHNLYDSCNGVQNPTMKLALSNIAVACDNYELSVADAVSDTTFKVGAQMLSKVGDKFMKGCIAYFPAGKVILLTQAITKSAVNFILSTDKIIEQYYKMERLYEFEMLVRATLKSQMAGYQSSPSVENANLLFAEIDVFFNTLDISHQYVSDFAKLMFETNIIGRLFGDTNEYNELMYWNSVGRSSAKQVHDNIRNTHYLYMLEGEYPEIYEAYCKQNGAPSVPKHINTLGVEFEKKEIEIGLEDSFGLVYANVLPKNATNQLINYTVSNPEIANYSFGSIRPYAVGTTVITATTVDGGYTDELIVNVVEGHGKDGTPPINPTQIVPVKVGDTVTIGGLKYKVTSDDEVELTGYTSEPVGVLYIPTTVGNGGKMFNVTSIGGYRGFKGCSDLINIIIPDSVKSVESYAFADCTGLTSIVIPDSVESVGGYAFAGCTGLTSVTIGSGVPNFGSFAMTAFDGCESIKKLIFSDGITYTCSNMTYAMRSSLEEVIIPDSVTRIGSSSFEKCKKLRNIDIPDSVTYIGQYAFSNCTGLTSIVIPNSVETVDSGAFKECTGLQSVTIGRSVTSFAGNTFDGCESIKKLIFSDGIIHINANMTNNMKSSLEEVIIPDSVTEIGFATFENCKKLITIDLPDNLEKIGDSAFDRCSGLTNIDIPVCVTNIGKYTFRYCTGLTSIVIPDSVMSVGYGAFHGCTELQSVTIGNGTTDFSSAFSGNIKKLIFSDGITVIKNSITDVNNLSLEEVIIPNSVINIERNTFGKYLRLTDVYYMGTESEWNEISISSGNAPLTSATIHYNYVPPQGDVNMDGSFNVADVVLLQKWLLAVPNVKLANWKAADLCEDGRLDVFDLCLMKRLLLNS